MPACVLVDLYIVISKAALFVGQCAVDQLFELLDTKRFEPKNLRTRDKRAVHIKERIVSRRTNQPEIAILNIRQKNVLLRLVEMMDLVNEQDRLLPRGAKAIRRRSNDAAHFGDVTFHTTDSNEFGVRHLGNDAGQRGLAAARRSGEDH